MFTAAREDVERCLLLRLYRRDIKSLDVPLSGFISYSLAVGAGMIDRG